MDMSIQSTLRLIHRIFEEGHPEQGAQLSLIYLPEAANLIDDLSTQVTELQDRLDRYLPDREMYE